MKKILLVILILVILLAAVIAGIGIKAGTTINGIAKAFAQAEEIDLGTVSDGVYRGKYGAMPVFVDMEITIENHVIKDIRIIKQDSGPGYTSPETVQNILQQQKLKVDAVSGATISSRCISLAALTALKNKPVQQ